MLFRSVRTPNGRWEHEGLRLVELPTEETDLLYALLRELSGLLVAPPDLPDPSGVVATVRTTVLTPEKTAVDVFGDAVDRTPELSVVLALGGVGR